MDASFPTWLPDLGETFTYLNDMESLASERERSEFANMPWPYFLEHKITAHGDAALKLLDFFAVKYPALLPVSLQPIEPLQVPEDSFDPAFLDTYHVLPFNVTAPFLSVAVVDPDALTGFYPSYVAWAKEHKFSLLQYFVALPSDVVNYRERYEQKK
jgi:hypothetical protein